MRKRRTDDGTMTNTAFILKILNRNFDELNRDEMLVIANNPNIFKMPKKFGKLFGGSDFDEKKRNAAIEMLNEELPQGIYIMNKLDEFFIDDPVYGVEFKKDFIETVKKLSIYRLCILIDKLDYYMRKYKICFFGNNQAKPNVWHEINKVVSDSFGLELVFEVFGCKQHYYRFEKLNYKAFRTDKLIACIEAYCNNRTYILYCIAQALADADEESINKKKSITAAINKSVQVYADIMQTERKKLGKVEKDQEGIFTTDILN